MAVTQTVYDEAIKEGDALAWQGRWEESLAFFQQALAEAPDDVLSHSNLGAAYSHLGRFGEALQEYRQVLQSLPGDVLALARIADCHARLKQMEECAATYLALGEAYLEQRNYVRATGSWRKLISLLPDHEEARLKLAETLDRGGDVEEAAEQYAALAQIVSKRDRERAEQLAWKALELDSNNAEAKSLLGSQKLKEKPEPKRTARPLSGQSTSPKGGLDDLLVEEEAAEDLGVETGAGAGQSISDSQRNAATLPFIGTAAEEQSFLQSPPDPEAGLALSLTRSETLMARGLYVAALDECYQAINIAPTYLPIHIRIGEILAARGRPEEAADKFATVSSVFEVQSKPAEALAMQRRMVELTPEDTERRAGFIRLLLDNGETEQAMEQQLLLAESRAQARQLNRAIADFREAIRLAPNKALPHVRFAQMLAEMGRTGDALREYEEAAVLENGNPEVALKLSIAYRLSGNFEEAQKYASKLSDLAKDDPGQAEQAAQEYRAAAEAHPDIPDFFAWAGLLLCSLGKAAEAIPYLEQGAAGSLDALLARVGLCRCYLAQGMPSKAAELISQIPAERLVELAPLFRQEAERAGQEGRWGDAVVLWETLKRAGARDDNVFVKLAEAYFRQGNAAWAVREFDSLGQLYLSRGEKKRAIAIFQVMKQLAPKAALPYQRLGDVYVGAGMRKEALAEYEVLADLLLKQGQTLNGIAALKRVVQLDSTNLKGHLQLGEALFTVRQYAEAAQVFRRLLELDSTNAVAQARLAVIRNASGG